MITAKNYAAQAIISLQERAITLEKRQELEKAELYSDMATNIKDSVHFVVPDGGIILKKKVSASDIDTPVNMPYHLMTIEFFKHSKGGIKEKIIILAAQHEDHINVFMSGCRDKNNWFLTASYVSFDRHDPASQKIYTLLDDIYLENCDKIGKYGTDELLGRQSDVALFSVFSLLEALSCRNISTVTFQEEGKKNQKRIREGKLPFYETKMLVVDSAKNSGSSKGDSATGATHTSPRQHLRRGHIRRLPGGNIWVNSCVVGDASKGTISKIYTVV